MGCCGKGRVVMPRKKPPFVGGMIMPQKDPEPDDLILVSAKGSVNLKMVGPITGLVYDLNKPKLYIDSSDIEGLSELVEVV